MKRLAWIALLLWAGTAYGGPSQVGGRTSPDGSEQIQIDLPGQEHMKNTGGSDGAGLCVFTSIEIAGHWDHAEDLRGFQSKMMREPGGGYPEKVDTMLKKYAPNVQYLQYSGNDPSLIKLALKTGRMVGVTYGYSPRYGGSGKISHMVDCVHLTDKWAAILDNNFPGEDKYEWMAPDEFLYRWKLGGGGWIVVILSGSPPPPIPINNTPKQEDLEHPLPTPWGCNCAMLCFCSRKNCQCKTGNKKCCPLCRCPVKPQPAPPTPPTPPPHTPQRIVGGWGTGGCSPVGLPSASPSFSDSYEWRTISERPGQWYLFKGGIQQGCLDMDEEAYHPYNSLTGKWGEVIQTPIPAPQDAKEYGRRHRHPKPKPKPCPGPGPCPAPKEPDDPDNPDNDEDSQARERMQNFGVSRNMIPELAAGETCYSINGRRVEAEEAFRLLEKGGTLTDDSVKQRLTIIGTQQEVNIVLNDIRTNPRLLQATQNLLVSSYDTSHWAVTGVNLPHDGHPTIVVQAPPDANGKGKVLHSQKDYQGGPEVLATAIRRADPNYDPKKDPDLRKANPDIPLPDMQTSCLQPVHLWCILCSLGMMVLKQFGPDLLWAWQNTVPKVVGFFGSTNTSKELADLKQKLEEHLARLQAIPSAPPQPEPKPAG